MRFSDLARESKALAAIIHTQGNYRPTGDEEWIRVLREMTQRWQGCKTQGTRD